MKKLVNNVNATYDVTLKVEVENQFLYSDVKLNYRCSVTSANELKFYIYKDIEVEHIICDRAMNYNVSTQVAKCNPFVLESKLIKLTFVEYLYEGDIISLNFKYKGRINIVTQYGINRLTKDWIELGLYTPWFPLTEKLERALFNTRIYIDDGYEIINAKKSGNYSVLEQLIPHADCTIIASKWFKNESYHNEEINVNVYYNDDDHLNWAKQVISYACIILNKYKRFGKIDNQELSLVIAPREDGGGYCRPGLIVLTPKNNFENELDYFKFIAHEFAHLWWCNCRNTNTWEDWLNESFAEYSALIVLREVYGEEKFDDYIEIYNESTKDLPPIKNLDRKHAKAYQVLYKKGPVLLNNLEKNIGREKFTELLSKVYACNIDTTENFLEKLCETTNKVDKELFELLLLK